jgi:hypothetical protein
VTHLHSCPTPTLTLPHHPINPLKGESGVLDVVVKHTGRNSKKTSLCEVNLVNIGPSTGKLLLLHGRNEKASDTSRGEADVLSDNDLAVALASECQSAGDGGPGSGLLRRGNTAKVEALQGEILRFGAGGLEGGDGSNATAEDVLDGDVGLGLSGDSGQGVADVDHVESVPDEVLVGADRLQGKRSVGNVDVVEL